MNEDMKIIDVVDALPRFYLPIPRTCYRQERCQTRGMG